VRPRRTLQDGGGGGGEGGGASQCAYVQLKGTYYAIPPAKRCAPRLTRGRHTGLKIREVLFGCGSSKDPCHGHGVVSPSNERWTGS
jgi:hypothetical protein